MTLLLVFASLLRTRQVTATAVELGFTQSSISHALGRLRDVFDDPLFIRRSSGMEPTARALELEPIAETIIDLSRQALSPAEFDLAEADGVVKIAALDHHCGLIAGPLLNHLRGVAPRLRVSFRALARRPAVDALLAGRIDLAVGLFWNLPETVERTPLWKDHYCVVGPSAAWLNRDLTLDAYLAARHLMVSLDGGLDGVVDKALSPLGLERRVAATVPYFHAALAVAAAGGGLLTIPQGFADRYAAEFDLRVMTPPIPLAPFEMAVIRRRSSVPEPLQSIVVDALVDITSALDRRDDMAGLAIRHGCGAMEDLAPENDLKHL